MGISLKRNRKIKLLQRVMQIPEHPSKILKEYYVSLENKVRIRASNVSHVVVTEQRKNESELQNQAAFINHTSKSTRKSNHI